jgi:hypothetical protein
LKHDFLLEPGTVQTLDSTIRNQFENGIRVFSLLFTKWMDTNAWSHPVMVQLAAGCLQLPGGKGWLHSSQISGLRHGKLLSPGPRTFMAIERLNFYLHLYDTKQRLLPGSSSSNHYHNPYVITEDGDPPELGWWMEVFCGVRLPKDVDVSTRFFSDEHSRTVSANWAKLIRRLLITSGHDIIEEMDSLIRTYYPVREPDRVSQLTAVLQNRAQWSPSELLRELPAITVFTAALGGPEDEETLLLTIDK